MISRAVDVVWSKIEVLTNRWMNDVLSSSPRSRIFGHFSFLPADKWLDWRRHLKYTWEWRSERGNVNGSSVYWWQKGKIGGKGQKGSDPLDFTGMAHPFYAIGKKESHFWRMEDVCTSDLTMNFRNKIEDEGWITEDLNRRRETEELKGTEVIEEEERFGMSSSWTNDVPPGVISLEFTHSLILSRRLHSLQSLFSLLNLTLIVPLRPLFLLR